MAETTDEKRLIKLAQEGDSRAFEKLVQTYDQRVLALAMQLVGNRDDAQDIYQEVFMRVFKQIHNFRFNSEFYTWLYRIVVNCAITYRKKRNRDYHTSLDEIADKEKGWQWFPADTAQPPDKIIINKEIRQKIENSLCLLSLKQRVVFVLRFFQDFKIKEVAQIMGCTEGTVKNYLFRATQKMRKELKLYLQ